MKTLSLLILSAVLCTLSLAQQNPVPLINQPLSPTSTPSGGASFNLIVNGTGFVSGSVINWNGSALPTTFVNNAQLTAAVSATLIANVGTATIFVSNPAPGGGPSNPIYFQIAAPDVGAGVYKAFKWTDTFFGVTSGDFNNDGNLDVAFVGDPSGVFVALGHGDGTFQNLVEYASGSFLASAFTADLNHDGSLDIIGGTYQGSTVSILLNNGDGTFQPPVQVNVGTGMERVAFADLNQDGKLDMLVTTSASTGQVSVLLGNGDGTF